jgi:dienelactone hydrolase
VSAPPLGLLVHEPGLSAAAVADGLAALRHAGFEARAHALSPRALEEDRAALEELECAAAGASALVGLGPGGTLAFLYACTRRLELAVDVEGPVLHPALSRARPTQPLELALNLEGAFLGLFGAHGPVAAEEREHLRARLAAAARPFELVVMPGGEIVVDPARRGYDEARARELWSRVTAFLAAARDEEDGA